MRYRFYTTSERAWAGMLSAIGVAERSIYLGMYIFENNTVGYDFLSELERRAREGVRVVIILDALGSADFSSRDVDRLRIAGAEVLFFSHWFRRMHQKMLIIDESVAFLGGVNIADKFATWRDLHVRISGRAIRAMLHSFARMYRDCGGKNPVLFVTSRKRSLLKKSKTWFIEHAPFRQRGTFKKKYLEAIDTSAHAITLVSPYFFPHRWLIAHLHQAMLRGVALTIIVPKNSDYWVLDQVNYYYLALMTRLGATCFFTPVMNHAKVMFVDDQIGIVGSQNIDALSFDWNQEAGMFFEDAEMIRGLTRIIEFWKKDAVCISPDTQPRPWYLRILAFVAAMFQPVL